MTEHEASMATLAPMFAKMETAMTDRTEYDVQVNGARYGWAENLHTAKVYAAEYVQDGAALVVIRRKEPDGDWKAVVTYRQVMPL